MCRGGASSTVRVHAGAPARRPQYGRNRRRGLSGTRVAPALTRRGCLGTSSGECTIDGEARASSAIASIHPSPSAICVAAQGERPRVASSHGDDGCAPQARFVWRRRASAPLAAWRDGRGGAAPLPRARSGDRRRATTPTSPSSHLLSR